MERYDVLVVGEINPDLILSGDVEPAFGQVEKLVDRAVLSIGSSSAIFACGAARLGLRTAFIGKCGEDVFGRYMLTEMSRRGVDVGPVLVEAGGATGLSVILTRGNDRAILTYEGLIPALRAEDVSDDLLRQSRHVHVASYFLQKALQPGLPDLFKRARAFGLTTSLDTNYDPTGHWRGVEDLLALSDVFFPNEREACALAGAASVDQAVERLKDKVNTLAVKLGPYGSIGATRGEKRQVPAFPVTVVDTVGAGDSFDAGFIYGFLQGWPLEKNLKVATVCGALSTTAAGGTSAQATLDEVLREIA